MKIENIFRKIPDFHNIALDIILFESKYPILFTCKNERDLYLFICCLVTSDKAEWIGTKTTYDNLIELLENKITIREAFLNIAEDKIIIEYNGQDVNYRTEKSSKIPNDLLPTAGEYMDAEEDEYTEEIAVFKKRNANIEYKIKPRINKFLVFHYKGKSVFVTNDDFSVDLDVVQYRIEKIHKQEVVLVG